MHAAKQIIHVHFNVEKRSICHFHLNVLYCSLKVGRDVSNRTGDYTVRTISPLLSLKSDTIATFYDKTPKKIIPNNKRQKIKCDKTIC